MTGKTKRITELIELEKADLDAVFGSVLSEARADIRMIESAIDKMAGPNARSHADGTGVAEWPTESYDPDKVERAALNLASRMSALHHYISEHRTLASLGDNA